MFKEFTTFTNFNDVILKNNNFTKIKEFRFGPRYFYGDVLIKVNEKKNKISYLRPAKKEDLQSYKLFETKDNRLNIIFEPNDPHQVFHCLIYNILSIVPLVESIDNIDIYLTKNNFNLLNIDGNGINTEHNFFMSYLKLILDKDINFIPIDLNSLDSNIYYMKDYVVVHIPEKHGITKETLDIVQKNLKGLDPVEGVSRKVYLKRSDSKYKRVPKNENIFEEYFKELGFSTIELSDYSVKEQISIIQNADILIGWSGSSFSNIFFSYNDKILIDLTYLPDKTFYYGEGLEDNLLYTNQPGNLETQSTRYNFDWSILSTVYNCTYMKINFEKIDTCEQALPILQNNKWFNSIIKQ